MTDISISERLKNQTKGKIIEIPYGEFMEQVIIDKPVFIKASNSGITIVGPSPTVSILKKGIKLENINIICSDSNETCLQIKEKTEPEFINVCVRGNVAGIDGEEGTWDIPDVLDLAVIPERDTTNIFTIFSPVHGRIYPENIKAISCSPEKIKPGLNSLTLKIEEIQKGCLLNGNLVIETDVLHLKRRIVLTGNTLSPVDEIQTCEGKIIWKCQCPLNLLVLSNFPNGVQGSTFEIIIDEDKLGSKDFTIIIEGLPAGLKFSKNEYPRKITGIPQETGEFKLKFLFEKDTENWEYITSLIIEEKKIIPLTIRNIDEPLLFKVNEPARIKFDILSSNSPDISFGFEQPLPDTFSFDQTRRELTGTVSSPGKINLIALISDGENAIKVPLSIFFIPLNPISLISDKEASVLTSEDFCLSLIIEDFEVLDPEIIIKDLTLPDTINIEKLPDKYLLTGKIENPGDYLIDLFIRDCFNREANEQIRLTCNNKPEFILTWPEDHIIIEGKQGGEFTQQILARINQKIDPSIQYKCKSNLPEKFTFDKNGRLLGNFERELRFNLTAEAEYKRFSFQHDFQIEIKVIKSTFPTSKKSEPLSPIWGMKQNDKSSALTDDETNLDSKTAIDHRKKEDISGQPGQSSSKTSPPSKKAGPLSPIWGVSQKKENPDVNLEPVNEKFDTESDKQKRKNETSNKNQTPYNPSPLLKDYELADKINSHLEIGCLNLTYTSDLFTDTKIINKVIIEVRDLPPGLKYDEQSGKIKGTPLKSGTFTLGIYNQQGALIKLINLKIEKIKKTGSAFG